MVTAAPSADVAAAVSTALTAAGVLVGNNGEAPATGGWQGTPDESAFAGYVVPLMLPGSRIVPQAEDPESDIEYLVQLRSFGHTSQHALTVADNARSALLTSSLSIAGRTVFDIRTEAPAGCVPEDDSRPRIWMAFAAFRIFTTGAPT